MDGKDGIVWKLESGTNDNPEDFWYDNMDEFEDYEEAAEYWQEEYGGDSVY